MNNKLTSFNGKLGEVHNTLKDEKETIKMLDMVFTDMKKQMDNLKTSVSTLENKRSYAEVTTSKKDEQSQTVDKTGIEFNQHFSKKDDTENRTLNREKSVDKKTKFSIEKQIPVQVTQNRKPQGINPFRGFKNRQKTSRFYVWGIDKESATDVSLRAFLESAGIRVSFLQYFAKSWKRTASAHINIHSEDEKAITDAKFWPEGIYIRKWLPRAVFENEKHE